jgi:intracellular sulfur oxidation DsrE/DsrF family protein
MSNDRNISDEQINALLDKQLAPNDEARVLKLAQQDEVLAKRIEERRRVKQMLSFAYAQKSPTTDFKTPEAHGWRSMAAAMLVFVVGAILGATGHMRLVNTEAEQLIEKVAMQKASPDKMIVQIDSNDPQRIREALEDAELLLRQSKLKHENIQLEVIANAKGLIMLEQDSPYQQQIARIASEHDNVRFLACGNGMRIFREKGIDLKLISQAKVVPGVTTQVAMRLNQGWSYLRE